MHAFNSRLLIAVAVICAASFVTLMEVKANDATDDQVSADAVWTPENDEVNEILQACKAAEYADCFIDQMGDYASSEAVAFSKRLAEGKTSRQGYLAGIREAGQVDLGYVNYPGNTEFTRGWVLLNGVPAVIDVDDLSLLPQTTMQQDAQFRELRSLHPDIHLVVESDDRRADSLPPMENLAGGAERFMISYSLRGDCTSCAPLAYARFGFDFDAGGEFLGAYFIGISVVKN